MKHRLSTQKVYLPPLSSTNTRGCRLGRHRRAARWRRGWPSDPCATDDDLQDNPLSVRLSGFAPSQRVTMPAEMLSREHFRWLAAATFVADGDGEVDVRQRADRRILCRGAPMGLIWSMERIAGPESNAPTASMRVPVSVAFRAEAVNGVRAEESVIRAMAGPGGLGPRRPGLAVV